MAAARQLEVEADELTFLYLTTNSTEQTRPAGMP